MSFCYSTVGHSGRSRCSTVGSQLDLRRAWFLDRNLDTVSITSDTIGYTQYHLRPMLGTVSTTSDAIGYTQYHPRPNVGYSQYHHAVAGGVKHSNQISKANHRPTRYRVVVLTVSKC